MRTKKAIQPTKREMKCGSGSATATVAAVFFVLGSLCFGRKAHIREQRWMSYLFAHQIIGNFAFHRVELKQYTGMLARGLTRFRASTRISISLCDNLSTVYYESYNLWHERKFSNGKHVHFRFVAIVFFGGTRMHGRLAVCLLQCLFFFSYIAHTLVYIQIHLCIKHWPNACYLIFLNLHFLN